MMNAIVLLHRWLGVAFALLFAMWFATGMVMHFVAFPSPRESERFAGLSPIGSVPVMGPADAINASKIADAVRIRLIQRQDGLIYLISGRSGVKAINATNGADAAMASADLARAEAKAYARNRGIMVGSSLSVDLRDYDQWTVPNSLDRYRPLFRVTLGDSDGREVYVASNTGEIVLVTTRHERLWNFVGSVLHWIYPTVLRRDWALWDRVVWTVSLLSAMTAALGAVLGIARLRVRRDRFGTPFRGWHALHHVIGLAATIFVLTWIISGWLSMDHGRLFSRGELTPAERVVSEPLLDGTALSSTWPPLSPMVREVDWFSLAGREYRRDRVGLYRQILFRAGNAGRYDQSAFLNSEQVGDMTSRLTMECGAPSALPIDDAYASAPTIVGAPVYRTICGDVWFDVDGASGMVLQRLDTSRRAYRWVYTALHTLDFPILLRHPFARTILVLGLCSLGFLFSVTGVVIGWRRLRLSM